MNTQWSRIGAVFLFFASLAVNATPIFVDETGQLRSSATSVDAWFNSAFDPQIVNSLAVPHASVQGKLRYDNDVDWFSFSGIQNATVFMDAVGLRADDGHMTWLELGLFNANGTLIGWGGNRADHRLLGEILLPETGTYYAAVSYWMNIPDVLSGNPYLDPSIADSCNRAESLSLNGASAGYRVADCAYGIDNYNGYGDMEFGSYILNISNSDPMTVAEPNSWLLLLFMALCFNSRQSV